MIQTTDAILEAINKKQLFSTVLLDVTKAFDSIHHEILITKLQDVGLSPSAIKWFRNCLQPRYQVLKLIMPPQGHAILGAAFVTLFNAIFVPLKLHHYIVRVN